MVHATATHANAAPTAAVETDVHAQNALHANAAVIAANVAVNAAELEHADVVPCVAASNRKLFTAGGISD